MDYLINPKTGQSYLHEFLETQPKDVSERVMKGIDKIEAGHRGHVKRMMFKCETFYAPLYEYEIDYKQGFRIYFTEERGVRKYMTAGVKKTQKRDVKFCALHYRH